MPAGLGSPGIEEYHGRHAGQESACGLCSPGRQQRGNNGPLIHAAERLQSTGSTLRPTCMHRLHHSLIVSRNVLHYDNVQTGMWTVLSDDLDVRDKGNN